MITDDDIKRVRDANDIVELIGERVVLKQRGREFWGNCPFHNEKTPSFKVDPSSQFYHCFGCGEGGDVFKYVMKIEGLDFLDAVRTLAQRKSIELKEEQRAEGAAGGKKARLIAACEETNTFYHQQLMRVKSKETDAAREYLSKRDLGGNIANDWSLGFAPGRGALTKHLLARGFTKEEIVAANVSYGDPRSTHPPLKDRFFNRVMFPISDLQGRTIAFGGRVIGAGEPKYLNSSDTRLFHKRENLFAIDKAKASITTAGAAIVVEGYTDVIAMHRFGFNNTVATLGTALTPEHLKLLSRFAKRVILLFDGDEAGMRAADRAADLILVMASSEAAQKLDLFVAVLPGKMDPADFVAAQGKEAMQATLDASMPLLRFALDRRLEKWDLNVPEQRNRALKDVVSLLVPVKGSLLAADYVNYLADEFAVDYQVVAVALENAKPLAPTRLYPSPSLSEGVGAGTSVDAKTGVGENSQNQLISTQPSQTKNKVALMEIELLFLYIEHAEVRLRLSEAFARLVWGDSEHEAIAQILTATDVNDEPQDVMAKLVAQMPEASSFLSSVRLSGYSEIAPNRLAGILMFNLREEQLKQAIKDETIKLRRAEQPKRSAHSGSVGVAKEDNKVANDDKLFEHIADLQLELSELRRKYNSESIF